jgi:hypothetical protein
MAALRSLHRLANPIVAGSVSPNFYGSWLSSQGYTQLGDAAFTASIADTVMTVTAVASGALAVGSLITDTDFEVFPGTTITALGTGTGGTGTYVVSPSQVIASESMTATGDGTRTSGYTTYTNVTFQVQALTGEELRLVDSLNIAETVRAIYMRGQAQTVQRPNVKGGDILQIPTGLTGGDYDVWYVKTCLENWDQDNWSKVVAVLQMPGVDQ